MRGAGGWLSGDIGRAAPVEGNLEVYVLMGVMALIGFTVLRLLR